MLLMPASNAMAWYLLVSSAGDPQRLLLSVKHLCVFHWAWAIKNVMGNFPQERAHGAFGISLLGFWLGSGSSVGQGCICAGLSGVVFAYAYASQLALRWPVSKIAHVRKKTLLWAHVMRWYYVSYAIFWGVAIYLLVPGPDVTGIKAAEYD
jgi:hypothetical protein